MLTYSEELKEVGGYEFTQKELGLCERFLATPEFIRTKNRVYPLIGAMTFVTGMCIFQLTRNILMNPDVRVSKANRSQAVLENYEEGERYAEHGLRKFLRTRPPEVMPAINNFFSKTSTTNDQHHQEQ